MMMSAESLYHTHGEHLRLLSSLGIRVEDSVNDREHETWGKNFPYIDVLVDKHNFHWVFSTLIQKGVSIYIYLFIYLIPKKEKRKNTLKICMSFKYIKS